MGQQSSVAVFFLEYNKVTHINLNCVYKLVNILILKLLPYMINIL